MTFKIHEGVHMGAASGVVVETQTRHEAGMALEPSGFWFMQYVSRSECHFHPYTGGPPTPCRAPMGYHTHPL